MTGSELVPSMRRLVNRRKRKNVFLGDGEIRTFLFDNGGKTGFPDYLSADQEGEMYGWQLAKAILLTVCS